MKAIHYSAIFDPFQSSAHVDPNLSKVFQACHLLQPGAEVVNKAGYKNRKNKTNKM